MRLGGSSGQSEMVRNNSSRPEFDPLTVQPIASRNNVYCIHALFVENKANKTLLGKRKVLYEKANRKLFLRKQMASVGRKLRGLLFGICRRERDVL